MLCRADRTMTNYSGWNQVRRLYLRAPSGADSLVFHQNYDRGRDPELIHRNVMNMMAP
jgi:hypothetical protein